MSAPDGPTIALVAHWDWVLYHFRLPVARALREQGLTVVFVAPAGRHLEMLRAEGFRVIPWRLDRRSLNPFREIAAIRRLLAIYRELRPTVAHHFTIKPNLYGSLAAWLASVPRVLNTFSGLGFLFSDSRAALWLRPFAIPVMGWAFERVRAWTLVLNEGDRDRLVAAGVATSERTILVPEGADLDRFQPSTREGWGPPVAVMGSRLLADKGVPEYIDAARILRDRGVAIRCQLAGVTDPGNPGAVPVTQVKRAADAGWIEFLGHRTDMPDVLAKADIGVLPSRYMEGAPRFLIEAAASGLPLVACDIPQVRRIVRHGQNGLLVPTGDPVALADALQELATDAERRARYGARGRALAESEFSQQRTVQAYVDVYRQLGVLPAGGRAR